MTIYDIALEAGVSTSTVSRVINGKPGIKNSTREKVKKLLEKYNYSLNENARSLATQSSRIVGILIEDLRISHHTDSAYVIEQEMTKHGYCCLTMSTGPSEEKKLDYLRILGQRRADGVILIGSMFCTETVKKGILEYLGNTPIAIVNGFLDLPNVYGILVDEKSGVRDCVKYLYKRNRKKLAFMRDFLTPSNKNKEDGFIEAMVELGWNRDELCLHGREENAKRMPHEDKGTTRQSMKDGYEMTKRLMKEHPEIDGIIYSVDLQAIGGIRALTDMGIRVPEQTSVIGIDNTIYGEICTPRLTTLNNKMEEVSRAAARILLDSFSGIENPQKIMLFTDIIERDSTTTAE